jgi:predicted RNA-binding protein with PUA-like domain
MPFLVKEEPENYSFDQFVKEGGTTWSGVRNPVAQKHLRSIR